MKKFKISEIIKNIKQGKVLLIPTDTVYGLIADVSNEKAVEKIFKIKKRKKSKPLLLFVKNIGAVQKIAYINKKQEEFLRKNWPGRVTAILKSKKNLPKIISRNGTVGIRIPNYKLLNSVLNKLKKPLAQTSANISGKPASIKIKEVLKQLKNKKHQPDLIISAGNLKKSKPSKIIDLTKKEAKTIRY